MRTAENPYRFTLIGGARQERGVDEVALGRTVST